MEIASLQPLVITLSGMTVTVLYELYLTMIDGKVLAVITNTSSKQACCKMAAILNFKLRKYVPRAKALL